MRRTSSQSLVWGENEVVEVADFPDEARASDVDDETQNGILTAAAAAAR